MSEKRYYNYYDDLLVIAKKNGFHKVSDAFLNMYVIQKKTLSEIAAIFKITPQTVSNHLKRIGVKRRVRFGDRKVVLIKNHVQTAKDMGYNNPVEMITDLYQKGASYNDLMAQYGISPFICYTYIGKKGLTRDKKVRNEIGAKKKHLKKCQEVLNRVSDGEAGSYHDAPVRNIHELCKWAYKKTKSKTRAGKLLGVSDNFVSRVLNDNDKHQHINC